MPGFLETTLHQGYDYLSPYVEKAQPFVEKVRSNVPLVDPALKKAEEVVPALITRADELAEPHVEKFRPYVEPKIEQVKEKVSPYVDEGVKKYGVLLEEGTKYYNVGLGKVEQAKEFKDAKVEQAKEFKDAKEALIREFAEPKVEKMKEFKDAKFNQIKEFTEPKVEKMKEFKEAKTTQIREFTEPKVEKIRGAMEPGVAALTHRRKKMEKLLRVPASLDVKSLNCETLLGKVATGLEKVETLMDRYVPLMEEQKIDSDSDVSSASDSSCVRINHSVNNILSRLLCVLVLYMKVLLGLPQKVKAGITDGSLKASLHKRIEDMKLKKGYWKSMLLSKIDSAKVEGKQLLDALKNESWKSLLLGFKNKLESHKEKLLNKLQPTKQKLSNKLEPLLLQATEKLVPMVATLTQTPLFKKVLQLTVAASEKMLGKERTGTLLSKVKTYIPAAFKKAPPPSSQISSAVSSSPPAKQPNSSETIVEESQKESPREQPSKDNAYDDGHQARKRNNGNGNYGNGNYGNGNYGNYGDYGKGKGKGKWGW